MPELKYWIATCGACDETSLAVRGEGECPFCGDSADVTFQPDASRRDVAAQDAVTQALWEFASANADPRLHTIRRTRDQLGVNGDALRAAVEKIMGAFGCVVTTDV